MGIEKRSFTKSFIKWKGEKKFEIRFRDRCRTPVKF